jgi:pimeloyl-ACP methyl ester carboxylesterase
LFRSRRGRTNIGIVQLSRRKISRGENCLAAFLEREPRVSKTTTIHVDFLEAGSGPLVMLVHSSVSGARQWRGLMDDLKSHFQVRAVNLFGYGKTPPWPAETRQSLTDQARLVEAALPAGADEFISSVIRSVGRSP